MPSRYRDKNRAAWDRLVRTGSTFAKVATDEECADPLGTLDSKGWLPPSVSGLRVLCLASGGGWQSILYACAGAEVTVVDISPEMLNLDEREASRRGLNVRTLAASMDDLSSLSEAEFDIVHQPVSTCYVPSIREVYMQVARVLKAGGLYISQHKQPTSLQLTHRTPENLYAVGLEYYRTGPLPDVEDTSYREPHTDEYLHRWDQLIGELCRTGFVLEDLSEPCRADVTAPVGHFKYRGRFVPPYVRLKARRKADSTPTQSGLWVP